MLACILAALLAAPAVIAAEPEVLVLRGATIVDGNAAHPSRVSSILVENGRITRIIRGSRMTAPRGATVMDLNGYWILPGLIDAHVHVSDGSRQEIDETLRSALLGGITAVRDMGGDGRTLAGVARDARLGDIVAPDVVFSALMAGPSFFKDPRVVGATKGESPGETAWARAVIPSTDLRTAMLEAKGLGATGVKIYANLTASEVTRITRAAHDAGLRVWSHATVFPASPIDAVRAGVDVISHSPLLAWAGVAEIPQTYDKRYDVDYGKLTLNANEFKVLFTEMARRGTILDATNAVFEPTDGGGLSLQNNDARFRFATAATKMAHERGVRVDAGTDSLFAPGATFPRLHDELAILVERCGFTPAEAIESATRINSFVLDIAADAGTIDVGKRANFVILSADPTTDIHNTRKIRWVIKDGRVYDVTVERGKKKAE